MDRGKTGRLPARWKPWQLLLFGLLLWGAHLVGDALRQKVAGEPVSLQPRLLITGFVGYALALPAVASAFEWALKLRHTPGAIYAQVMAVVVVGAGFAHIIVQLAMFAIERWL